MRAAPSDPHPIVKPPVERLYGRIKGHALRPKQQRLLDITLPRMRVALDRAAEPRSLFGAPEQRLAVEVGFGGGEHALAQAAADPGLGLIACEVFTTGLCSLLSRLVGEHDDEATTPLPANLRVWDDDARAPLRALPPACLDAVFLLFPDPWPKARHAKRRFVHPEQVPLVARAVKPGGEWRIASDDPIYQAWVTDVMAAQDWFAPASPATVRPDGWPPTRYEAKALRAGRQPLYWSFRRSAGTAPPLAGSADAQAAWATASP
jgi:tRNA (guanine-N7-)-methyltransferase